MTNEAVITDKLGDGGNVVSYSCLNGTAMPKGSVMEQIDNRTVQTVTAAGTPLAGILVEEKVAGDGQTQVGVYTNVVAKMTAGGGAIAHGDNVVASAAVNVMAKFDTLDDESGYVLGYAMETVADGETFHVRVKK
jgi:hypothetical protein